MGSLFLFCWWPQGIMLNKACQLEQSKEFVLLEFDQNHTGLFV